MNKYDERMIDLKAAFIGANRGIPNARASEADLDDIEQKIGVSLPVDYREFLRDYGMFFFRFGAMFNIQSDTGPKESSISVFYSALLEENYGLLENYCTYHEFEQRIPSELLPIGDEGSGSQICLAIVGPCIGSIYFWDSGRDSSPPDYSNVYLVADSFDSFIKLLKVDSLYEQEYGR